MQINLLNNVIKNYKLFLNKLIDYFGQNAGYNSKNHRK